MVACQSASSVAEKTIFYQPLNQDSVVTQQQWQQLFQASAAAGYTSLVVQWSRYNDTDFLAEDGLLPIVLQAAAQFNFKVWLGLSVNANYFNKMQQAKPQRQQYFRQQLAHNLLQLNRVKALMPVNAGQFAGWYLPLELNDTDFATIEQQHWLSTELALFARSVADPLAISVYSNGDLTVTDYLNAIQSLAKTGLKLWLQDGAGAGLISQMQRQQLLTALPCNYAVIAEHFRQPHPGALPFRGRAATEQELMLAQQAIKPCHATMAFSLRYQPFAVGILNLPGE
ncbi:DUF4434 domain-containing protein [Rheinheimera sp. D18]|uniref:DUF4434 domain-containing protein n=1 Tax=Rheinheimera sp. D18 TaxID=2545632 RepID=UPI001404D34C|nr:DUF4434 domain-containing protein [Rheinheimera sp. D18]